MPIHLIVARASYIRKCTETSPLIMVRDGESDKFEVGAPSHVSGKAMKQPGAPLYSPQDVPGFKEAEMSALQVGDKYRSPQIPVGSPEHMLAQSGVRRAAERSPPTSMAMPMPEFT